jgi:hypothetical protein
VLEHLRDIRRIRPVKLRGEPVGADLESVFQKLDESRNHILSRAGSLRDWAAEPMVGA